MKLITTKYQISKDIFEIPFEKEDIIKDVHNRILGNIAYELEDLLEIEQEEFISFPHDEIHFQTDFYITSTKEFDELCYLIRKNKYNMEQEDYLKFKKILTDYEK